MPKNLLQRVIILFGGVLLTYAAHVAEEATQGFPMVSVLGGVLPFVLVNGLIFALFAAVGWAVWKGKRWALYGAFIFAVIMWLNGLGHTAAMVITRAYFPGGITGIVFLILSGLLLGSVMRLLRAKPTQTRRQRRWR